MSKILGGSVESAERQMGDYGELETLIDRYGLRSIIDSRLLTTVSAKIENFYE